MSSGDAIRTRCENPGGGWMIAPPAFAARAVTKIPVVVVRSMIVLVRAVIVVAECLTWRPLPVLSAQMILLFPPESCHKLHVCAMGF